jgi:hypothetical protein
LWHNILNKHTINQYQYHSGKDNPLPQVNYKHEKRQRELEKKKKKDQKIKSKLNKKPAQPEENSQKPAES